MSRDDNGNPADAVRVAEELLSREKVAFLIGTFPSNVGLAVADFAKQRKTLFIAAEPLTDKIVWDNGNAYTFRLRTSTYMQTAMLIPDAAKLKKKRWAIVYPNYEYGTVGDGGVQEAAEGRSSPTSSSSPSRRRRSARSTPARWRRRWPMPSPTRSSPRCSAPTSPSSCARAASAACSRASRCSTCWAASPSISIR